MKNLTFLTTTATRIYELPEPIKAVAILRQLEADNNANQRLPLTTPSTEGGFNWDATPEDSFIWGEVDTGNYYEFYKFYGLKQETVEITLEEARQIIGEARGIKPENIKLK